MFPISLYAIHFVHLSLLCLKRSKRWQRYVTLSNPNTWCICVWHIWREGIVIAKSRGYNSGVNKCVAICVATFHHYIKRPRVWHASSFVHENERNKCTYLPWCSGEARVPIKNDNIILFSYFAVNFADSSLNIHFLLTLSLFIIFVLVVCLLILHLQPFFRSSFSILSCPTWCEWIQSFRLPFKIIYQCLLYVWDEVS